MSGPRAPEGAGRCGADATNARWALLLALAGCGVNDPAPADAVRTDAGSVDASPADASPTDASPTDASPADMAPADAAPVDASPPDAFPPPPGVGDDCRDDRDCAATGLTCLGPERTTFGAPLGRGRCARPCAGDDADCPLGAVCGLPIDGAALWCTPQCLPAADGPGDCRAPDDQCHASGACRPRCADDATCRLDGSGDVCDPVLQACVNPGGPGGDGEACAGDGDCGRLRRCVQGFCTIGGCALGGDRACGPASVCVPVTYPGDGRRHGSECRPRCDLAAPASCRAFGMRCLAPESNGLGEAADAACGGTAVAFSGRVAVGDPGCVRDADCAPALDQGACVEGRCGTLPGACRNPALRAAGVCGDEGLCASPGGAFGPVTFTCARRCSVEAARDGASGCAAGDGCHPLLAGGDVGVCRPSCVLDADAAQVCASGPGALAGGCDVDAGGCAVNVPCDPDRPDECLAAGLRCHPVRSDVASLGARGVCREPCTVLPEAMCPEGAAACDPVTGTCPVDL